MAENASGDSTEQTEGAPRPLITLSADERRRQLLESLRAGHPPISEVFRTISDNESRYISQFTSSRWREHIYPGASDDDGDTAEDEEQAEVPEKEEPRKLFIYGYDLPTEEYARETEMIMRWNIVEREQYFPNLRTSRARNRSKVRSRTHKFKSLQKSSVDVAMNVCQGSPKVVGEHPRSPNIAMEVVQESVRVAKDSLKVTEKLQDSSNIVSQDQVSPKVVEEPQGSSNIAMEVVQESLGIAKDLPKESGGHQHSANISSEVLKESSNFAEERLESLKTAKEDGLVSRTAPESETSAVSGAEHSRAKHSEGSSESNMKTSGTTMKGKRKADSVSSVGEGTEDPDEKRTKTTEE